MKKLTAADPETKSLNLVAENIAKLKALFPELLTEGKDGAAVNVDVLKQLVGDATVTDADEKYGLTWNGKRKARLEALKSSTGTLRPAKADSMDWHSTQNLLIEGDNLEVLKLLQKSYANQVKLIYIDPPYNTGNDMVYEDDYQDNLRNYQENTSTLGVEINPETSGRYHTNWLKMIHPRLVLAKNILAADGLLCMSIDDHELMNARIILDEVFGSECFMGCVVRATGTTTGQDSGGLGQSFDYLLCYSKDADAELAGLPLDEDDARRFQDEDEKGKYSVLQLRKTGNSDRREDRPSMFYSTKAPNGEEVYPIGPGGYESRWRFGPAKYKEYVADGMIVWKQVDRDGELRWQPYVKYYLEGRTKRPSPLWDDLDGNKKATIELRELFGEKVFSNPKPLDLLKRVLHMSLGEDKEAIVLDFFAGSGTTGHAVMAQNAADGGNRRYILVQLPEPLNPEKKEQKVAAEFCDKLGKPRTIAELTKERLRRAAAKVKAENPLFHGDLGFRVFKLDTSNLKAWDPHTANVPQSLLDAAEHVKPDRTADDLLYELLLKKGLDLAVPMERKTIAGKEVVAIGGGVMLVCLAEAIDTKTAEPLALGIAAWHQELAPANPKESVVVFRDSAFEGNVAKSNLAEILKQRGLEKVNSI